MVQKGSTEHSQPHLVVEFAAILQECGDSGKKLFPFSRKKPQAASGLV